jgi:hypothetical protein
VLCFIISNIIGGKVVNAQHYVFYFESDIAKVFQFRPTCSYYDSEIKKSQKEPKRTSKESEQMSNLD